VDEGRIPAAQESVPLSRAVADRPGEILRRVFGHAEFRPGQRELIDAVLAGRDALGVLPTGAGKPVTFALPARLLGGTTVVFWRWRGEEGAARGRSVTEAATRAGESLDDAFSKLLGRQATDAERERLHRVRDVLGLGGNDALWLVLLALEHYDSLFREYPRKLGEALTGVLEAHRATLAASVAAETASVTRALADAVIATSEEIAAARAAGATTREKTAGWTAAGLAIVGCGALAAAVMRLFR
jgi:hypothetical protein